MTTKQFIKMCLVASMAVLALAPFSTVRAEDAAAPTIDIVASGVGMNETEATKDALGNAVRQAIGAIVGTDSLVQNEEVIRDQILTYSDGFAENYETVGKPTTALNGLISVTIRARIVRSKLIQKTKAANIAVLEVDGKGMFAEAVTKIEQSKSATEMLAKEFRDMPKSLIKAEVVGKPSYNEKTKTIQVVVQASVDRAAYDALIARILPILDGIGAEAFTVASSDVYVNEDEKYVSRVNFPDSLFPESYRRHYSYGEGTQSSIVLCALANGNFNSTQWKVFMVDESVLNQINAVLRPVTLSVDVVGGDQSIMDSHYVAIGKIDQNDRRMYGGPITLDDRNPYRLFVYPGLAEAPNLGQWSSVAVTLSLAGPLTWQSTIDFDMPPEKLKDISQIVCKVTSAGVPAKE